MMESRDLSSAWTFVTKFVFPIFWIVAFGSAALSFWFGGGIISAWLGVPSAGKSNPPPPGMDFVFLGVWIVGSIFILWFSVRLKRVSMDARQLLVSNYRREISIPFNAILDVRQNRWVNLRPVTIYLREATEFGDRITFMPKQRMVFRTWRVDPIVDELKQLAGLMPRA
jgi:hypothetical protein